MRNFLCLWPLGLLLVSVGCSNGTARWLEQAKSGNAGERLHAIHILQERANDKETVVPVLVVALEDENSYVRRDAARALGVLGARIPESRLALASRLRDKEPSVRKAAAFALKQIGPK